MVASSQFIFELNVPGCPYAGLLRVLRGVEGASWVDALLALWLAALRTVQRVSRAGIKRNHCKVLKGCGLEADGLLMAPLGKPAVVNRPDSQQAASTETWFFVSAKLARFAT
jgi:hypothetical protein